ncbi:2759_t:CDS:2 [Diversispora eburnea]|uniref:2759_t:CDS:1 n=1 Tax=Diversispora eburnea TaxID=1213867 RepID=A0A9N8V4E0_9GLOM|nr:2759_t:CDS:2 [Diversispora eburnea]
MTLIHPEVIRGKELLIITAPGKEPLQISLNEYPNEFEFLTCSSQVCGDNVKTLVYISEHITRWFTEFLGVNCRLARQPPTKFVKPYLLNSTSNLPLSLSNESPFLLISQKSVDHVNQKILEYNDEYNNDTNNNENNRFQYIKNGDNDCYNINNINKTEKMKNEGNKNNFTKKSSCSYENRKKCENLKIVEDCFRANLVINGNIQEYEEDKWKMIKIRGQVFK